MHDDANKLATETMALSNSIKPMLAGRDPGVMGGALADLVALWLAGHHPAFRHEAEVAWIETMRALIKPSEKEIAELYGDKLPPGWGTQ